MYGFGPFSMGPQYAAPNPMAAMMLQQQQQQQMLFMQQQQQQQQQLQRRQSTNFVNNNNNMQQGAPFSPPQQQQQQQMMLQRQRSLGGGGANPMAANNNNMMARQQSFRGGYNNNNNMMARQQSFRGGYNNNMQRQPSFGGPPNMMMGGAAGIGFNNGPTTYQNPTNNNNNNNNNMNMNSNNTNAQTINPNGNGNDPNYDPSRASSVASSAGAQSLHRYNSATNFDYEYSSTHDFDPQAGQSSSRIEMNSVAESAVTPPTANGNAATTADQNGGMQRTYSNSQMLYSFGSFANGAPGMGAGASVKSSPSPPSNMAANYNNNNNNNYYNNANSNHHNGSPSPSYNANQGPANMNNHQSRARNGGDSHGSHSKSRNGNSNGNGHSTTTTDAARSRHRTQEEEDRSGKEGKLANSHRRRKGPKSTDDASMQRFDSTNKIERKLSIAGQFYANNNAGYQAPPPPTNVSSNNNPMYPQGGNGRMNYANHNSLASPPPQQGGQSFSPPPQQLEEQRRLSNLNNVQQMQQQQQQQMMMMRGGLGPGRGMMRLNSRSGGMTNAMPMNMQPPPQQQQQQMMMMQRGGRGGGMMMPPKRQGMVEQDVVQEGEVAALGRKNSSANLARQPSEKRIGMYFKNKAADDEDVEYKKQGDPDIASRSSARQQEQDPSMMHTYKTILFYQADDGNMLNNRFGFNVHSNNQYSENDIEIDGKTVRALKPGNEEVSKYDFSLIAHVQQQHDLDLTNELVEEMRDVFAYGCNVAMLLGDADCPASRPTSWFTWHAVRNIVKDIFSRFDDQIQNGSATITMSLCYLQDDEVMDLLSDANVRHYQNDDAESYVLNNLVVVESPLFGNAANGLVYMCIEDAGEFNDTLDSGLAMAEHKNRQLVEESRRTQPDYQEDTDMEFGIVLCTLVLKQVKRNNKGEEDVVVSSLFASGVGNGVIHYDRILDKNPAEPRAVFYSALHRSVHGGAFFSCSRNNANVLAFLSTLQRFAKLETRKPKVGSARVFARYAAATVPKVRNDLKDMKDPRQRAATQKFVDRLDLMGRDAERMLENPKDCVPNTYA